MATLKGKVVKKTDRGFGFLEVAGSTRNVFFHLSGLVNCRYDDLQVGTEVSFTEVVNAGKTRAEDVRVL